MVATVLLPRIMRIGAGASAEVAAVAHQLGVRSPLIVTDAFMLEHGPVRRIAGLLEEAGIKPGIFSDTVPDPTVSSIDQGVAALKAGSYDCIIAIGGGSPIDSAKAIAILGKHGGRMRDYKVPFDVCTPGLPVIAIPTTAGTGSEATRAAVITDDATDEKMLCMGLGLVPVAALVDYELTLTMPLRLTADTGLDSLTHAIEAYVSKKRHSFTDGLALTAMRAINANIRAACYEPENRAAREAMMLGATEAGIAFSNASVCLVHGMSRPIGAFFHVPHGLSNAMLLPAITEFSIPAAQERYADCARAMDVATDADSDALACEKLVAALKKLNEDLQVPTPKAYGIDRERYFGLLQTMAEQALGSGSPGNNPRVPSAEEIIALYEQVYE